MDSAFAQAISYKQPTCFITGNARANAQTLLCKNGLCVFLQAICHKPIMGPIQGIARGKAQTLLSKMDVVFDYKQLAINKQGALYKEMHWSMHNPCYRKWTLVFYKQTHVNKHKQEI